MTYSYDGSVWLVRFQKGEKLIENLIQLINKEQIKGAWISGLGGALSTELGFYDLENHQYHWQSFGELMEITSLQGNIAYKDNEPVIHIHGTFTKADFSAIGGHVKELVVGGTCEIIIHRWNKEYGLKRIEDTETGLTALDLAS